MSLSYQLWDVFTDEVLTGNPLAIVPDAEGLDEGQMQAIAREFNLSETSFVLPSDKADLRARYFTPKQELPTAGHPTIGTVFALHKLGRVEGDELRLELGVGEVPVRLIHSANGLDQVWMSQGVAERLASYPHREVIAKAVGLEVADLDADLPVEVIGAGNAFLIVPVVSLEALAKARTNKEALTYVTGNGPANGVFVFTQEVNGADVQGRMFADGLGVPEDPATGSAHGPLGWYLAEHGKLRFRDGVAEFSSRQGVEMGRPSRLEVRVTQTESGYSSEVGGSAVQVGAGELFL